jgi:hypothetical protein
MKISILIATISVGVYATEAVVDLNNSIFDEFISSNSPALIEFYAPSSKCLI